MHSTELRDIRIVAFKEAIRVVTRLARVWNPDAWTRLNHHSRLTFSKIERVLLERVGWMIGGGFLFIGLFPSPIGIGVMGLLALLYGAMEPLYYGLLHHQVPSSIRATTESSVSMLWHLGILGLGIVFIIGTTASLFLAFSMIGLVVWVVHATAR
jgi:hypothetical protein